VLGPGHNSVIAGPNDRELFCVYHRWHNDERVLAIDRLDLVGDRIFIKGPTNTPQSAPFAPSFSFPGGGPLDQIRGWEVSGSTARNTSIEGAEFYAPTGGSGFSAVFSARLLRFADDTAAIRV